MTYSLNTLQNSAAGEAQPVRLRAMRFAHEITLIAGFVVLLFWLLAMLSFTPSDAAWSTSGTGGEVKNWGGRIGAWLADASYFLAGYSVWWCLAAGLRVWLSSLAGWMRGGEAAAGEQAPRGRSTFPMSTRACRGWWTSRPLGRAKSRATSGATSTTSLRTTS